MIQLREESMKNIGFMGLFLLLANVPAQADPRDDALSTMLRCSAISDRTQRLACYDTSVARVPGALNNAAPLPPPPAPLAAGAAPPACELHGQAVRARWPQAQAAYHGGAVRQRERRQWWRRGLSDPHGWR